MLLTSTELEAKFNLDSGYINSALIHEKCPTHFIGDGIHAIVKYEEADAVTAIRSYYEYQKRLAMEKLEMWGKRSERFEATLIELG